MDFLLEVGCEEIPARFVAPALEDLGRLFGQGLADARLEISGDSIQVLGTPRRLALLATGLPRRQADLDEQILGPRVEAAYDAQGNPTMACIGFAKSKGVEVEQLIRVPGAKGEVVAIRRQLSGRPTAEVLGPIVAQVLAKLNFPKTMRWGTGEHQFARPVHWLLALLGDQVLELQFAGIRSGRTTRGHRFSHPQPIEVAQVGDYRSILARCDVQVDPAERRARVAEGSRELASQAGGRLVEDAGLELEIAQLTEYPIPLLGRFDEAFLSLPREVLVAAMRNHQRYFSIEDPQAKLINAFVAVGNTPVSDPDLVRHGNERVLTARLADAQFFFSADQRVAPADRVPALQDMIFQADLGSYYDKAVRIANLVVAVAHQTGLGGLSSIGRVIEALTVRTEELTDPQVRFSWQAARAALLAKTDLLTELVGEFPELQGIMGGEYARLAGEDAFVAEAIRDHYRPRSAQDAPPAGDAAALLSIADRLDTLAGCFGVGLRPTGGADPYALRRQCLGLISVVLERGYRLSLKRLLGEAVAQVRDRVAACLLRKAQDKARKAAARKKQQAVLPTSVEPFEQALVDELLAFVEGRLRARLAESAPPDVVDAVLAVGLDDLCGVNLRVAALAGFSKQPAFADLAVAFKRVVNIIKGFDCAELDPGLFEHPEEKQLHDVYTKIKPEFERLVDDSRFDAAMELLGRELRAPVDGFFEKVLVNDPNDTARQANRKALLSRIALLFGRIADFSRLQTRDPD